MIVCSRASVFSWSPVVLLNIECFLVLKVFANIHSLFQQRLFVRSWCFARAALICTCDNPKICSPLSYNRNVYKGNPSRKKDVIFKKFFPSHPSISVISHQYIVQYKLY